MTSDPNHRRKGNLKTTPGTRTLLREKFVSLFFRGEDRKSVVCFCGLFSYADVVINDLLAPSMIYEALEGDEDDDRLEHPPKAKIR